MESMAMAYIDARAEVTRLKMVLRDIELFSGNCMEGAGEPEFSQFARIENKAHGALAASKSE